MLICDGFGTYETLEILEHYFANNILLCRLPSHTSHKLQRYDVAVFTPLKVAYHDNVERMERGGVNTIRKQHFTSLCSLARAAAFNLTQYSTKKDRNLPTAVRLSAVVYPFARIHRMNLETF